MNRLLTVIAVLIICGIGLGFYRGWFHIDKDSDDGTTHIKLTVDQKKMQDDEKRAVDKVRGKE